MDFYTLTLTGLVLANAGLLYRPHRRRKPGESTLKSFGHALSIIARFFGISRGKSPLDLEYVYLPVYALVVASDWLQGPYLYPLYRQTLGLPENTVAALFSTGFISGAISATFTGNLADRYGRKKACLSFCIIYSLSCLLTLSSNILTLFVGRVLGGIGTTLLFTVFEAWLVAEFNRSQTTGVGSTLSDLLGLMTVLNSIAAVLSGLMSNTLVWYTGSSRAPFLASVVCLILAFLAISKEWDENYRNGSLPVQQSTRVSSILKDKRVLGLGAITTIFEGTMYLFVVFWAPALISARKHNASDDPPFGLIFASFMAAMMLGSQLASRHMSSSLTTASSEDPRRSAVSRSFTAMIGLLHMGSWALSWSVFRRTELAIFLAFCTYEFAIGVYYPNMGVLKSLLVKDEHRASVYALFRLPLNCFVFTGLALTKEGETYRNNLFTACSALLLIAVVITTYLSSRQPI